VLVAQKLIAVNERKTPVYTFSRRSLNAVILLTLSLLFWPAPRAQAQCTFTNGDFETSNLNGWTVYSRVLTGVGNAANWYNYAGNSSPLSSHTLSTPPQGTRAAVADQNQASVNELYQDFTFPAGQSGTLTFYHAYNNLASIFVTLNTLDFNNNQQFRVDLMKTTAANETVAASDIYRKLLQTQPGDPLFKAPTLMTFDLSGFAGLTTRLRFAESVGFNWMNTQIDNVCLSTTRGTITRATATGTNVNADFGGVTLRFPTVTTAGTTSLTQLNPATAQTGAPLGDTFIGPAYDLSTTATVTASVIAPITVCMYLPGITDDNTFSKIKLLHKEAGIWIELPSSRRNMTGRLLCGDVTSLSPFTAATNPVVPTAAPATISGTITAPDGAPLAGVTVILDGPNSRKTITDGNGNYIFASVDTGNFYTVTPSRVNYHFDPANRSFSLAANLTDAAFTSTADEVPGPVIDSPDYFVRQHYLDFLGREPDESGFNFWSNQILSCGSDTACIDRRTVNVSAAYFFSIEFQQTGGLVDGLYRASYGRRPSYDEFMPDAQSIAQNLVVGRNGWQQQLATNKTAFIDAFVSRATFRAAFDNLSNQSFVDTLVNHTGVSFSDAERAALVNGLSDGTLSRAGALQRVAENQQFVNAKRNEMFVMMEYFGYLRRDPDESGYQFWLNKLNQFDGNFEQAEMVKAFINSGEYRARFPR
jgi:hypothetical protein